jgi:hypothetical protein
MNPSETEPVAFDFHFFGDLWLEEPKKFLNETDLSEMNQYLALIQALDKSWERRRSFPAFFLLP